MATREKISDAEWQRHEETICRLYIVEKLTLDMLVHEMSSSYGFTATKSQYKTKLKAWDAKKNLDNKFWKGISGGLKRRHLEVSEANVYFKDDHVSTKRLKKELQRHTAQGGRLDNDAPAPPTPKGVTIQPVLEQIRSTRGLIPRNLTTSLPWHKLIEVWSQAYPSPTLDQATLSAGSPLQVSSPGWTFFLSQTNDVDFYYDIFSSTPWEQLEPPLFTGTVSRNFGLEHINTVNFAPLQNEVMKYFGIETLRVVEEDAKTLERHLRPFAIERQPEETLRAVQDLMNPGSTASMRILMSYMALLFSNDLFSNDAAMDSAIQAFLARAEELHQLGNFKPLFVQGAPSARAVTTRLLHAAILLNSTKFLSQALNGGADLESPSTGENSLTLLQKALISGKDKAARILIDAGANLNVGLLFRHSGKACDHGNHFVITCDCKIQGSRSSMALAAGSRACVDLIPELLEKGAVMPEEYPVLSRAIQNGASLDTIDCLIRAEADVDQCASIRQNGIQTPLSIAAIKRNLQVIQKLLEAGANPNGPLKPEHVSVFKLQGRPQGQFQSPLLCALKGGNHYDDDLCDEDLSDIVRLLLRFGANPNISAWEYDDREDPLLFYPLQAAAKLDKIELVELLIQHKASVNSTYGTPALVVAVSFSSIEIVRLLLSKNADPNGLGKQNNCESALEAAVMRNDLDLIDLLLESGADVNKCSSPYGGRTPLQRAAEYGEERVIEHLLKHGASMLSQPALYNGKSVLQGFVQSRLHKYVSKALEAGLSPSQAYTHGSSPLAAAILNKDTLSLHLLLVAGAKVHEYAKMGFLDYEDDAEDEEDIPICLELSPIQWAAAMGSEEIARILCEAGADVNQPACKPDGEMALHLAVSRQKHAMASFLIAQKAEVNAYSGARTAIIHAIECDGASMLRLLLENGADPNQPGFHYSSETLNRRTPLDYACYHGKYLAARELLRAGAHVNQGCALTSVFSGYKFSGEPGEEILEILLEYGADVNKRPSSDDSPLQRAISAKKFDCAYRLIEEGACINDLPSIGERGLTALQAAASVGDVDMIEHLLSRGANVNAPAAAFSGVTALQAAAIKGYLRIAQILLEHGADIGAKAGIENGRTAIEGAAEFGRIDMVKFLLDNYQGPEPVSQMCARALKAAEKGKQWFVMEQLATYEYPGQAWPETTAGS